MVAANNPADEPHDFEIPAEEAPAEDALAVKEANDFEKEWLLTSGKLEWWLRFLFKILLSLLCWALTRGGHMKLRPFSGGLAQAHQTFTSATQY